MRFYEDPLKTSENRLSPRSYYIPGGVSEYISLNGEWKFAYFSDEKESENIKFEEKTTVPSCWQNTGTENPNYTNARYPFPYDPPYVPDINPCAVYERDFEIKNIIGKTYFVLEGVSSLGEIFVNGRYIGFTQGSHLPAEFDISEFINKGKNTIRVKVYKWCCGSYLEDQDEFRCNGIFRDCYLLLRPTDHIVDPEVYTKDNTVYVNAKKDCEIELFDNSDKLLASAKGEKAEFKIEDPIFWNAEKPYRYKVVLKRNGEEITLHTLFRTIEISDTFALLINGTKVKLHGVNHHDTDPTKGWAQDNNSLLYDLKLMKKLNINCIRTSHYPPTPFFMEKCEELGFYVILETDIESHGALYRLPYRPYHFDVEDSAWLCQDPKWEKEFVERMKRAAEYYKNYGCIIMWSTGNESGHGVNHEKMIEYLRTLNDGRLIHCEDASRRARAEGEYSIARRADIFSWMYPSRDIIGEFVKNEEINMPVFFCEYAHAMGNSPGGVCDYDELFESSDKLIGGCVWEWADHTAFDKNGVPSYGGDFEGELTNDGNFCCDGMVFYDRSLKAGSLEIKTAFQPLKTNFENGILTVLNRFDFTNLKEFELVTEIGADKEILERKIRKIDLAPHEKAEIKIEIPKIKASLGAFLTVRLLKDDYEYAVSQHLLDFEKIKPEISNTFCETLETESEIIFKGDNFKYTFQRSSGNFSDIEIMGKKQIVKPPVLSALRAYTDNERNAKRLWVHDGESLEEQFSKIYSAVVKNNKIIVKGSLAGISRLPYLRYEMKISADKSGVITYDFKGKIRDNAPYLQRFGMEFTLPSSSYEFSYFGYGPQESYCDMYKGASLGFYESNVRHEYVNYIRPQEHGNHFGCKDLNIGNMKFSAETSFECNVSEFKAEDLIKADHINKLKKDGYIHLRIDYKDSGIGSASCGPALPEIYTLNEKDIDFKFYIIPNI